LTNIPNLVYPKIIDKPFSHSSDGVESCLTKKFQYTKKSSPYACEEQNNTPSYHKYFKIKISLSSPKSGMREMNVERRAVKNKVCAVQTKKI
jgi:hypothetical protein